MNGKLLNHPLTHLLTILLLGAGVYANSLGGPFVFDDLESIVRNETIRNLGNFLPGGSGLDFHFRRSVAYFTFALNYRFGGLDVTGYHVFNLAVHLATALLVYALVRLLFRTPALAGSHLVSRAGSAAFLAALLFVAHPVQTQAVTYVVQRLTSLCTFFYLLTIVLYAWGRVEQQRAESEVQGAKSKEPRILSSQLSALCFLGSLVAAVLAMFTKEIAFTLPLAALLYEASFFRGPWRRRLPALLPLLLTLPIIPSLVLRGGELTAQGTLVHAYAEMPRVPYLLTQFPVIVTYLRLWLLPVGQNVDYDYPLYTTFFAPVVMLSFLLLAGLLGLAGWLYWKTGNPESGKRKSKNEKRKEEGQDPGSRFPISDFRLSDPAFRLIAFGLFWFFLTISIEAGLVPLPDVIFEHRLYLPSIGLAMILAVAVMMASQRTAGLLGGRLPLLVAAVVIVALGAATWQRNRVWHSEVSLWEDTLRKSPRKVRALYNYGTYLADAGQAADAVEVLSRAVALDPRHDDAWHNLGRAYLLLNRTGDAITALRTAVGLNPRLDNAVLNFTSALIRSGAYREAIDHLEEMYRRAPDVPGVHMNLGLAYTGLGDLPAARSELAILWRLDPGLARALAGIIDQAAARPAPR